MLRFCIPLLLVAMTLLPGTAWAQEVPWDRLPNVDASKLDDSVRARARSIMEKEACYHECEDTVLACVTLSPPCSTALRMAGFIVRQVVKGKSDAQISQELMDRARSVHPFERVEKFASLRKSLCMGDPKAPVQVVVFADLDCPFCKVVSPALRRMLPGLGNKVAFFYLLYPVKGHGEVAVQTSKAALAAADQGKFWEFHDRMYEKFEAHSDKDIEGYVKDLGMDWERFAKVWKHPKIEKAVSDSKKEGLALGVKSTPTIFINGKRYYGDKSELELKDRIEEEIELLPNQ